MIIPPTVDTVESVIIAVLNINRVSPFTRDVAQDIGEARVGTSDVLQEVLLFHLLHRQLDGPVFPLSILKQIFFPVKVPIEFLASCVLLNQDNQHILENSLYRLYLVFIEKNVNDCLLVEVHSFPGDKYSSLEAVNHTFTQSVAATGSLGSLTKKKFKS